LWPVSLFAASDLPKTIVAVIPMQVIIREPPDQCVVNPPFPKTSVNRRRRMHKIVASIGGHDSLPGLSR